MKYFLGFFFISICFGLFVFINMVAEEQHIDLNIAAQNANPSPSNATTSEPQKELPLNTESQEKPHSKLQSEIEEVSKQLQEEIKKTQETLHSESQYLNPERMIHVILAPHHRTILSSQVSNPGIATPVLNIYHRMGESVKKGELLILIQDDVFKAGLEKARAVLKRYEAALYAKNQLFKDDLASFLDLKEAQANVASAMSELTLAELQLSFCYIRSPYNGKVVGLSVEEHETPQPGQPLIELVDDEVLLAKSLIPSTYISKIAIGKIIKIKVNETQTEVEAAISRIGAIIDPASSTIAIEAEIDNSQDLLKAGMTGVTTID